MIVILMKKEMVNYFPLNNVIDKDELQPIDTDLQDKQVIIVYDKIQQLLQKYMERLRKGITPKKIDAIKKRIARKKKEKAEKSIEIEILSFDYGEYFLPMFNRELESLDMLDQVIKVIDIFNVFNIKGKGKGKRIVSDDIVVKRAIEKILPDHNINLESFSSVFTSTCDTDNGLKDVAFGGPCYKFQKIEKYGRPLTYKYSPTMSLGYLLTRDDSIKNMYKEHFDDIKFTVKHWIHRDEVSLLFEW